VVPARPTGAGKTTLLRLIAGLERPDAGNILFDERDVTDDPPAQRNVVGRVPAVPLYPHLTVFDNLAFPLRAPALRNSRKRDQKSAWRKWLASSGSITSWQTPQRDSRRRDAESGYRSRPGTTPSYLLYGRAAVIARCEGSARNCASS